MLDVASMCLYRDLKSDLEHKDPDMFHCGSLAWLAENTTDELSTFNTGVSIHYAISRLENIVGLFSGNKIVKPWKERVKAALYHKTSDLAKQKTQIQAAAKDMIDKHKKKTKKYSQFTKYWMVPTQNGSWKKRKQNLKQKKQKS